MLHVCLSDKSGCSRRQAMFDLYTTHFILKRSVENRVCHCRCMLDAGSVGTFPQINIVLSYCMKYVGAWSCAVNLSGDICSLTAAVTVASALPTSSLFCCHISENIPTLTTLCF